MHVVELVHDLEFVVVWTYKCQLALQDGDITLVLFLGHVVDQDALGRDEDQQVLQEGHLEDLLVTVPFIDLLVVLEICVYCTVP